jgi:hypothetical protein
VSANLSTHMRELLHTVPITVTRRPLAAHRRCCHCAVKVTCPPYSTEFSLSRMSRSTHCICTSPPPVAAITSCTVFLLAVTQRETAHSRLPSFTLCSCASSSHCCPLTTLAPVVAASDPSYHTATPTAWAHIASLRGHRGPLYSPSPGRH